MATAATPTTAYKPRVAAALVGIETTPNTRATMTLASNAIPVKSGSLDVVWDTTNTNETIESPRGGVYLGQPTSQKCSGSFETYAYGAGVDGSSNPVGNRLLTNVLQTCFDVTVNGSTHQRIATPTISTPLFTDASSTVTAKGKTFSIAGYVGSRGRTDVAAAGSERLFACLVGCSVTKVTVTEMVGDLTRFKVEFVGVADATDPYLKAVEADLDGFAIDAVPIQYVTPNAGMLIDGDSSDPLYVTKRETVFDFGGEHVMSDTARFGVGGTTTADIAVTGAIDPLTMAYDYDLASYNGTVVQIVPTNPSYPQSGTTAGYGFLLDIPAALVTVKTNRSGKVSRTDVSFVAGKNTAETDAIARLVWV